MTATPPTAARAALSVACVRLGRERAGVTRAGSPGGG